MADKDYAEDLFQAVDTIVHERTRHLPYDQTIVATITNNNKAYLGLYQVTTDSNIQFNAYSSNLDYNIGDIVYIRIPGGDYTKQKVIVDKYIAESNISADFTNGVFYRDTQANIYTNILTNDLNSYTFTLNDNDSTQGYNGFNIIITATLIDTTLPGSLTLATSVKGKNYTELNSTIDSIYNGYDNRIVSYTINTLVRNVSYPLININPRAIILQFTNLINIASLQLQLTLGYLWQERLNIGVFRTLLYNADDKSTYYNPEVDTFSCSLGAKLLMIDADADSFLAVPQELTNTQFYLGLNEGIEEPSYQIILNGNYDTYIPAVITENIYNKIFTVIIHPSLQMSARLARLKCYFKTITNVTSISNEYIIYSQTKLSSIYKNFTLTATPNEFYIYNSAGQCIASNTTCLIKLTYINKINTNDTITIANITTNLNQIPYFSNIELTSNNGRIIEYTCTIDINGILSSSIDIVPINFNIIKDDNTYNISTIIYFGQKQINETNTNLFYLDNDELKLGGKDITSNGNWAGNAATATLATTATTATTANKLSTNAGGVLQPIYFANGVPVAITSTVGASNKPIYANAGILTSISSLDDTLLGFTNNTYGFTTVGKNTKLYAWLKAIQTNINTLAAKHTDVTVSWPGNITL